MLKILCANANIYSNIYCHQYQHISVLRFLFSMQKNKAGLSPLGLTPRYHLSFLCLSDALFPYILFSVLFPRHLGIPSFGTFCVVATMSCESYFRLGLHFMRAFCSLTLQRKDLVGTSIKFLLLFLWEKNAFKPWLLLLPCLGFCFFLWLPVIKPFCSFWCWACIILLL